MHRTFRFPLTLEKPVYTPDGGGGRLVQWQEVTKLWADVEPSGSREKERDGRFVMHSVFHIYIRYRSSIDATMRFRNGAQVYRITALQDEKFMHQILRCNCEAFDVPSI